MKPWHGMPKGQGMADAVSFREWRVNRSLYIAVGALMLLPWMLVLFGDSSGPGGVMLMLRAATGDNAGMGPINGWNVVMAGLLALGVFWNDRSRGGLETSLEGPVARRALLLAKMRWGLWIITGVWVLLFAIVAAIAVITGHAGFVGRLGLIDVWALSAAGAVYVVTVSFGAAMGSAFFTGMAALLWVELPRVVESVLFHLTLGSGHQLPAVAAMSWQSTLSDINWLSPLTAQPPVGWLSLAYAAYFAAWGLFMGWRALVWWEQTPMERFHDPFYYPQLWNLWYAFLAILSGMFVAALAIPNDGYQEAHIYIATLIFGIPLWFLWRWAWRRLSRSALTWGPEG